MRTVAVVLAGGSGVRLGGGTPKQLQLLAGRTLLEHCVAAFDAAPGVDEVVVVMPANLVGQAIDLLSRGGQDCNVLFHDAARPLVDQRIIADCVAGLADCQALGVVVPTADTIAQLDDGVMTSIPPRESLGRCQTPQGFRLSVIRRAYRLAAADPDAAAFRATDDCGIVLRYLPGVRVRVVAGSERNLKITYPGDLRIAEAALSEPLAGKVPASETPASEARDR